MSSLNDIAKTTAKLASAEVQRRMERDNVRSRWQRDEIARARAEHALLEVETQRIRLQQRAIAEQVDRLEGELRPTYPTAGQLAGIADAALAVRTRRRHDSHHGERTRVGQLVEVHGERGWIGVGTGSPRAMAGHSGRLWSFTDDDVAAIRAAVEAAGLVITDQWLGGPEGAVCMTVTPAPPTRHLWCGGRWKVRPFNGGAVSHVLVDGEVKYAQSHPTWDDAIARVDRIMRAALNPAHQNPTPAGATR